MPTFTTMKREVRALLAERDYLDLDFVNCHPSILEQTLDRNCIPCPLLSRYNEERSRHLQAVIDHCGVTMDLAKELFIRILYLGSVDMWLRDTNLDPEVGVPSFINDLAAELRSNTDHLLMCPELKPFVSRVNRSSPQRLSSHDMASISSAFLQTQERACLDALCDAIVRDGFEVGALIYDGLHIVKSPRFMSSSKMFLKNWRAHTICNTGGLD